MESSVEASRTPGGPKPALAPKPLLAPKPFSLQKNTAIRSIHAPRTNPAPKTAAPQLREQTAPTGSKAPAVKKPLPQQASVSQVTKYSTAEETPDSKAEKPHPAPVSAPLKPTSVLAPTEDFIKGDHGTTTVTETTSKPKDVQTTNETKRSSETSAVMKELGPSKKSGEQDVDQSGNHDSSSSESAFTWGGSRKRLSMHLTSKFESGGAPAPTKITSKDASRTVPTGQTNQSGATPETKEIDKEETEGGGSIKRRISLLFDSSSRPEVATKREEPDIVNGGGGVKERIKNWTSESNPDAPKTEKRPPVVPRTPKSDESPSAPMIEGTTPPVKSEPENGQPSAVLEVDKDSSQAKTRDAPPEKESTEQREESNNDSSDFKVRLRSQSLPDEGVAKAPKRDNVKRRSVRFGVVERDDGGPPIILGSGSDSSSDEDEAPGEESKEEISVPSYRQMGILHSNDNELRNQEDEQMKHMEFEKRRKVEETVRPEDKGKPIMSEWEMERAKEEESEQKRLREEEIETERQTELMLHRHRQQDPEKAKEEVEKLQSQKEQERVKELEKEEKHRESRWRPRHEGEEREIHEEVSVHGKLRAAEMHEERKREEEWEKEWVNKTGTPTVDELDELGDMEWTREKERLREVAGERERRAEKQMEEERKRMELQRKMREEEQERNRKMEIELEREKEEQRKEAERERQMELDRLRDMQRKEQERAREEEMERQRDAQRREEQRAREEEIERKREALRREQERAREEEMERQRDAQRREEQRAREEEMERQREALRREQERAREEEMERQREALRREQERAREEEMERQREAQRREQERAREEEKERMEYDGTKKEDLEKLHAEELKQRMEAERNLRDEERQRNQSLINFDSEDIPQHSTTGGCPVSPEGQIEVVYDDFSVKKPLIEVDFDDFSVKPVKWGSHTKMESSPVERKPLISWDEVLVEEIPTSTIIQPQVTVQEKVKEVIPDPTPAHEFPLESDTKPENKETEEGDGVKTDGELIFSMEMEEKEQGESHDDEGHDVLTPEAEVGRTDVDDEDTDVLIEPEEESGDDEQTTEADGSTPATEELPEEPTEEDSPDLYTEPEVTPFPEPSVPLLDTSAQRSKASLSRRRSRKRPSRSQRLVVAPTENQDWRTCDSTAISSKQRDSDTEDEPSPAKMVASPPTSQRVPMFPGMSPAALIAQLKKRGPGGTEAKEDEPEEGREASSVEEAAPSPSVLSRSPRSAAQMAGAARVLPPIGGKEGSAASPAWLKELKSKKRLSQHEGV
ncbi:inner centromere protein A-like isoform X2 [Synchiropus splendidus]|uniref:inner centromere protein A-like isoform X2 n=1 Tax=Synchiropus splendidus TaxID=270530 RepID=UPI00237D725B|nr:inner centromere protein A-like isoform X2 [Synchiropus splendidus]